jgi:hypothetical protein
MGWGVVVIFAMLLSCKENNLSSIEANQSVAEGEISTTFSESRQSDKNILTFNDWDSFNSTLKKFGRMNRQESESWEKAHNFTSLRTIYERGLDKQEAILADLERTTPNPAPLASKKPAELVKLASTYNGRIILGSYGLEINLANPAFASLLNAEGMVRVGQGLYQVTANETKSIRYSGPSSAEKLDKITKTELSHQIFVEKVRHYTPNARVAGTIGCDKPNPAGDLRLITEVYTSAMALFDYSTGQNSINVFMGYKMHFRRAGTFGWTNHRTESYRSYGQWGVSSDIGFFRTNQNPYIPSVPANTLFTFNNGYGFAGKRAELYIDLLVNSFPAPVPAPQIVDPNWHVGTEFHTEFVEMTCDIVP